jgi:hypothetical protein
MRRIGMILLLGLVPPGCGGDSFGVEDAWGIWDLVELNGLEVLGTAPRGIWIRENGGSDSTLTSVQVITLEFAADSTSCLWEYDDGIQGAETEDDCSYTVSADGDIAVDVADRVLEGRGEGYSMTLRDEATNEFVFQKRT